MKCYLHINKRVFSTYYTNLALNELCRPPDDAKCTDNTPKFISFSGTIGICVMCVTQIHFRTVPVYVLCKTQHYRLNLF